VDDGFFDGTIFHRVIPDFMIQGGGFTPDMKEKETREPIVNEADNTLKNLRGTIAMARTGEPDSATAQFFINVQDNPNLDHAGPGAAFGYAVFGKVIEGMDVVDKIRYVKTHSMGQFEGMPDESVVIKSVKRPPPAASH
jgi:cyclophilin family peptidyl-prolyl cis-trans isomerase